MLWTNVLSNLINVYFTEKFTPCTAQNMRARGVAKRYLPVHSSQADDRRKAPTGVAATYRLTPMYRCTALSPYVTGCRAAKKKLFPLRFTATTSCAAAMGLWRRVLCDYRAGRRTVITAGCGCVRMDDAHQRQKWYRSWGRRECFICPAGGSTKACVQKAPYAQLLRLHHRSVGATDSDADAAWLGGYENGWAAFSTLIAAFSWGLIVPSQFVSALSPASGTTLQYPSFLWFDSAMAPMNALILCWKAEGVGYRGAAGCSCLLAGGRKEMLFD